MGLEADLTLQFSDEGRGASCQGKLTYDRLREKVMLDCANLKNELLFRYKTLDLNFELYLPGQKKVIRGNIFDLQFDPDVSVYLLPQDLYRALKPMLIEPRQARLTGWDHDAHRGQVLNSDLSPMGNRFKLNVLKNGRDNHPYLARTLLVTKQGDVPEETFYQQNGTPQVLIRRTDFIESKMADLKKKVFYPRVTEIQSLTTPRKTILIIRSARFWLHPKEWP